MAPQVHHDAETGFGDAAQGPVQLGAAVAAAGPEDIPGEALAVDPHQHVLLAGRLTHNECQVGLLVDNPLVGQAAEVAEFGGQPGLRRAADQALGLSAVADQVGDGDQQEAVFGREGLQVVAPGHPHAVLGHDLAEHAGGGQTSQPGQVDGGLGMPRSFQDPTVPGPQDVQVARDGPGRRAPFSGRSGPWW